MFRTTFSPTHLVTLVVEVLFRGRLRCSKYFILFLTCLLLNYMYTQRMLCYAMRNSIAMLDSQNLSYTPAGFDPTVFWSSGGRDDHLATSPGLFYGFYFAKTSACPSYFLVYKEIARKLLVRFLKLFTN
jgi:hypothetical protein